MHTRLMGVFLFAFLALGSWGCGGQPKLNEADATKQREKMQEAVKAGQVPTGMPADVMQEKSYPGAEEAAKQGGFPGQKGTQGQEKYYKK